MTPNTPTPDYGEPWRPSQMWSTGYERAGAVAFDSNKHRDRIIACVNACAGMADPAKEIAAMREALNLQGYKLAGFEAEVAGLRAENEAMREAIVAADKAIRMLNHEGMCFCDAQYATNAGSHPRHSDECVQTNVALAKLQPYTTHDTDT